MSGDFSKYYRVKEFLGQGGFGTVKRCVEISSGQEYAVKIINKHSTGMDLKVLCIDHTVSVLLF